MEVQLFEKYWKNYNDAIVSLLIRRANSGSIDISTINKEIKIYSKRWLNDKNIEGLWLQELKVENPVKADAVIQIISKIELKTEQFEIPSLIRYYVYVTIVGILSILIVFLLSLAWWKVVLIPILCIMLAYGFLIPQGNSKREQAIAAVIQRYVLQIDSFKKRIDQLLYG
jgi:uncharacterized membrane protein